MDSVLTARAASKWYLPPPHIKPAHTHTLVWRQLADSTRASHVRWLQALQQAPPPLRDVPLAQAVVHIVLQEAQSRQWSSWATVACALSSVASALRQLPVYSRNTDGIDIRAHPHYAAAARRAQHLARVTKRFLPEESMAPQDMEAILGKAKDDATRLFFSLAWCFAARVGDLRQVLGADVTFGASVARKDGDGQLLALTFRRGKGACFWGPFTVQAVIPAGVAKALAARLRLQGRRQMLFSPAEQQRLSVLVNSCGFGLRSIRKGRLSSLANAGASSTELQLLSGHKRLDTLYRYLGWGVFSADARRAAISRDQREQATAGEPMEAELVVDEDGIDWTPDGPRMGPHSGYAGLRGQRIAAPPVRLSQKAPKRRDLGLIPPPEIVAAWPLKAARIATLSWKRVIAALGSGAEAGEQARSACEAEILGNNLLSEEDWLLVDERLQQCIRWCSAEPLEDARPATAREATKRRAKTRLSEERKRAQRVGATKLSLV